MSRQASLRPASSSLKHRSWVAAVFGFDTCSGQPYSISQRGKTNVSDYGLHSPNPHTLLDIRRSNSITQTHHKFRNLFDVDDVLVLFVSTFLALYRTERVDGTRGFGSFGVDFYDLCASGDL
jgi:hypothetical protein